MKQKYSNPYVKKYKQLHRLKNHFNRSNLLNPSLKYWDDNIVEIMQDSCDISSVDCFKQLLIKYCIKAIKEVKND